MSTIITAAILILGTAGFWSIFVFHNMQKSKKRLRELMIAFNQAGADKGMAFSSQELLTEKIIGLDGLHHQLLIFEFGHLDTIVHINLHDLKNLTRPEKTLHC